MCQNPGMNLPRLISACCLVFAASACVLPPLDAECQQNPDCGATKVCAAGKCVQCAANADCAVDNFCCQGECLGASSVEAHCGCGPALSASAGDACDPAARDTAICLVGDVVATSVNVAQGTCGCGCTAAQGGPICEAPAVAGEQPTCSCNENADCKKAAVDLGSQPHRVADTCTPDSSCVCFSLGTAAACDPDSATPDCASEGGCQALGTDPQNCGQAGRSCTAEATGVLDTGVCVAGGCSCSGLGDCVGADLNVNDCVFPTVDAEETRCVCNSFTVDGVRTACPMELVCAVGGCVLDGTAFATDTALRAALGLP